MSPAKHRIDGGFPSEAFRLGPSPPRHRYSHLPRGRTQHLAFFDQIRRAMPGQRSGVLKLMVRRTKKRLAGRRDRRRAVGCDCIVLTAVAARQRSIPAKPVARGPQSSETTAPRGSSGLFAGLPRLTATPDSLCRYSRCIVRVFSD